ncbi:MAG: glutathione S-transferase, partial [Myxococcota bacterium]
MTRRATLYAAEVSLYSGKVRAYLQYKRVPFDEALPSRDVIERVLRPRTGVRMIPVLIDADDVAVQDTTAIIDHVEATHPERAIVPETPKQRFVSQLMELYADEWLLMPAMHYRWAYPRHHLLFIAREFGQLLEPRWPAWTHVFAGLPLVVYFGLAHGPVLGIDRYTRGSIEAWYEAFLGWFDAHLARYPFVLGARPSLGDFGLMAPLYAHLWRDPYSGRQMRRLAPRVADWVERMRALERGSFGEWLEHDEIPETLVPILRHALDEHLPIVRDTWAHLHAWHQANPDLATLPRFVGRHEFTIGYTHSTRAVQTYTAWQSQRTFAAWHALHGRDRRALAELLGRDLVAALDFKPPLRLGRS